MSDEEGEAYLASYAEPPPAYLTAGDEMLGAVDVAKRLHTTPQAVRYQYDRNQIIGLTREVGSIVYPLTQFIDTPSGLRWPEGLDAVVARHGNGWSAWLWLIHERRDLHSRTALACLRAGDVGYVRAAIARDDDGAFC
ncbi:hypothetical protein [Salinisphaera shabanensis]